MNWAEVEKKPMGPGVYRQALHSDNLTIARIYFEAGSEVAEHSHDNEQISQVIEGSMVFVVGGKTLAAAEGDVLIIQSGVPHKARANGPSVVLDTFCPPRKDWMDE